MNIDLSSIRYISKAGRETAEDSTQIFGMLNDIEKQLLHYSYIDQKVDVRSLYLEWAK